MRWLCHNKLVQLQHKDRVHKVYEVCQHIHQPKGHNKILIDTISCSEVRLGYIFIMNLDLAIARVEINFGEYLGSR
jgi:hypothetical protein